MKRKGICDRTKKICYFEVIYFVIALLVIFPGMFILYDLSLKLASIKSLTPDNLLVYLIYPTSIIVLPIIGVLWGSYILFQIVGLCLIFDKRNEGISVSKLITNALYKTLSFFKKKNISIFLIFLALISMFFLTFNIGNIIPLSKIIRKVLFKRVIARVIIYLVVSILLLMGIYSIFTIHQIVLEDKKGIRAFKAGNKLFKDNYKSLCKKLVIKNLIVTGIIIISYFILVLLLIIVVKAFNKEKTSLAMFLSILYGINTFLSFFVIILYASINMKLLGEEFSKLSSDICSEITLKEGINVIFAKRMKEITVSLLVVFFIVNSIVFFMNIKKGKLNILSVNNEMNVTAHRGSSLGAPENTLSAFKLALDEYSNYIELDVQMTKDRKVVVFHDEALEKIANDSRIITEMTYDELSKVDVGSHYSEKYKDERVPLLSEVFDLVGKKAKLNIEIKPYTTDEAYLRILCEEVYRVIGEYDAYYLVVISSFDEYCLNYLKEKDPDLTVGLVTSIRLPSYDPKKYDFISMKYQNIDLDTIKKIHSKGIKVHVWTVNKEEEIVNLITLGVDNIITDNPLLARKIIYTNRTNFILRQTLSWFFRSDESIFELLLN